MGGCAKTDGPVKPGRPLKIHYSIPSESVALEQGQDSLRRAVGRGQHARAGLHQNLVSREIGGFRGEVGVRRSRFRWRSRFPARPARLAVLVSSVFFSNAPSRPCKLGNLLDGDVDDLAGRSALPPTTDALPPVTMSLRNPTALFPSALAATEPMPMLTCCWLLTSAPSWNRAPPPVMVKLVFPMPKVVVQGHVQVKRGGVELQFKPVADGQCAVDGGDGIGADCALGRSARWYSWSGTRRSVPGSKRSWRSRSRCF